MVEKLKTFSLSTVETKGIQLEDGDVQIGVEEGHRSLIGKVYGDKKANFTGVKSSLMKLWQYRGLSKVVALSLNTFQFVFNQASDRDGVMQGRPWFFDNQFLILYPWTEHLTWDDEIFNFTLLWVQVWNIPNHWLSIESGRKIGSFLGTIQDILVVDSGTQAGRHIKLLLDMDVTKPLVRGTKLQHRQCESWIHFRYEQLPLFCYYCGCVGHSEKGCASRKRDMQQNCLKAYEFGPWLRAHSGRVIGTGGLNWVTERVQSDSEQDRCKMVGSGENMEGESVAQRLGNGKSLHTHAKKLAETDGIRSHPNLEAQEHLMQGPKFQELKQSQLVTGEVATKQLDSTQNSDDLMLTVPMGEADREQKDDDGLADCEVQGGMTETPFGNHPLMDCSNRLNMQLSQAGIQGPLKSKGQWKRKVRMQGQGDNQHHTSIRSELGTNFGKRKSVHEESSQIPMKKQVVETVSFLVEKENLVTISEVEETSRDWSQHYK